MFGFSSIPLLVCFVVFGAIDGATDVWPAVTKSRENLPNITVALAPSQKALPELSFAIGELEKSVSALCV
jgi:hypothetical protein